jgi:hypothetical protein
MEPEGLSRMAPWLWLQGARFPTGSAFGKEDGEGEANLEAIETT